MTVAGLLLCASFVAGCSDAASVPPPTELPDETRSVSVYFSTGRSLLEEPRVVDATDVYTATLEELLAAEPENKDTAVVQPEAAIRSVTFDSGLVTVDWDPAVLEFEADDGEYQLAWAALLLTMGQFEEVERMAFSVDGKTEGMVNDRDIAEFWRGVVTLKDQPWDVTRPPGFGDEATATPEPATTP